MRKQPWKKNKNSGNVSLSKSQYESVVDGTNTSITVFLGNERQEVVVEEWMIKASRDEGDYILFPYLKKSFLAKRYFASVSQK